MDSVVYFSVNIMDSSFSPTSDLVAKLTSD
jgi:hypothetical protein